MIDLASLLLVCVGGVVYLVAYFGMEELRRRPHEEFVPAETVFFGRTRELTRLTRVSYVGLGLCGVGVLVALSAAAHAHIIARKNDVIA